ncbi:MAG: D-TA family PLP-dependent enzyme [Pseudomonadota bacterium]
MKAGAVETPAVLIDDGIVRRNIARYQAYCDENRLALRPHIKTHKLPDYAKLQVAAGAVGITCQKLTEAEIMAEAGLSDILITYNILGASKRDRLRRLADQVSRLAVTADNAATIDGLSQTFAGSGRTLNVLVECNTGANRCGVETPGDAALLARRVADSAGLSFGGLMTYPPVGGGATVAAFMASAKDLMAADGLDCAVVSSGGSPDMWQAGAVEGVSEHRIGTYIYNDRSLVARGVCTWQDCALTVLSTIVSTPAPGRAIIDAGSKILTTDLFGQEGFGHVLGHPDVAVSALSEEHGTLTWDGGEVFRIGDSVRIVPNHACVVSNMVDHVWIVDESGEAVETAVAARGGVT